MKKTYSYTQKIIQFFAVLLPIFITQLAIVSTGFFDTVMSGHVSEYDLAGVAIGANVFFPFFGSSLGIISGLTPSIAHLYGARKYSIIKFVIQQGFYWSLLLGLIFILAGFIFTGTTIFLSLENVYDFLKESGRLKYIFKNFIKTITHLTILIIYSLIIKFFSIDILILIVIGVSLYTLIELLSFLNIFGSAFEANSALDEEKEKNEKKQKEMEAEMDRQLREKENEK